MVLMQTQLTVKALLCSVTYIVKSKLPSYKALCSPHLPLSLYCIAANAVVKYCIPYQGLPYRLYQVT